MIYTQYALFIHHNITTTSYKLCPDYILPIRNIKFIVRTCSAACSVLAIPYSYRESWLPFIGAENSHGRPPFENIFTREKVPSFLRLCTSFRSLRSIWHGQTLKRCFLTDVLKCTHAHVKPIRHFVTGFRATKLSCMPKAYTLHCSL